MGRQIVKQPDGLYSVWSTIVDDFIIKDMSINNVYQFYIIESVKQAIKGVKTEFANIANGFKRFSMNTWGECEAWRKLIHQDYCDGCKKQIPHDETRDTADLDNEKGMFYCTEECAIKSIMQEPWSKNGKI